MPSFIKGLDLCAFFHDEAVRPILTSRFPQVRYSSARLDYGSDVLGYDTPRSVDHDWGPRLTLFLSEEDAALYRDRIVRALAEELPVECHGYSTNFGLTGREHYLLPVEHGPVAHWVQVTSVPRFFEEYIGLDPTRPIRDVDWLSIPQQHLRTIASGRVFFDGLDTLGAARLALAWYPHDIWLYLMACQWQHINQEEPFMARCGDVGDELGSRLIATRQVQELMRLCYLIEKHYAPYTKWFGSGFAQLACAEALTPLFHGIFSSTIWREREQYLSQAYLVVARMHNALGITRPIESEVTPFYERPYLVLHSGAFVEALYAEIRSEAIRSLPRYVGAIGQFVDSTDVLTSIARCKTLATIYRGEN